jgi:hypothetical protein
LYKNDVAPEQKNFHSLVELAHKIIVAEVGKNIHILEIIKSAKRIGRLFIVLPIRNV